jgi:HEAT repeat protein
MRRFPLKRYWLITAALTIGLLIGIPAHAQDDEAPELSYDGRTLSQWEALLQDPDPKARTSAIRALAGVGARGLPIFVWAMDDQDPGVRLAALKAIALLGHQAAPAVPTLTNAALHDPVRAVRLQAIYALGQLGQVGTKAIPTLRSVMRDGDLTMRINAAQALEKITGETR